MKHQGCGVCGAGVVEVVSPEGRHNREASRTPQVNTTVSLFTLCWTIPCLMIPKITGPSEAQYGMYLFQVKFRLFKCKKVRCILVCNYYLVHYQSDFVVNKFECPFMIYSLFDLLFCFIFLIPVINYFFSVGDSLTQVVRERRLKYQKSFCVAVQLFGLMIVSDVSFTYILPSNNFQLD